jgi:hypothetical protein
VWEIAYAHYGDPRWRPIIEDRRPYGDYGHSAVAWTTLTHGVPFGPPAEGGPPPDPTAPVAQRPSASPAWSASADVTAALDRLATRLREPWSDALAIRISWRTDPRDADVVVERSVDGDEWRAVPAGDDTHVDEVVPIDAAVDYRLRPAEAPRAAWSTIDDLRVRRLEATSRTVDLDGSWSRAASSSYSGGSALSTDQADASIVWRGTARSLIVVGPVGPTRGRMVIDVDGDRAEVVDLYAPAFAARSRLFAVHWNDGNEHEVRIEARHRGDRTTVAVDDLVTLSATVSVAADS